MNAPSDADLAEAIMSSPIGARALWELVAKCLPAGQSRSPWTLVWSPTAADISRVTDVVGRLSADELITVLAGNTSSCQPFMGFDDESAEPVRQVGEVELVAEALIAHHRNVLTRPAVLGSQWHAFEAPRHREQGVDVGKKAMEGRWLFDDFTHVYECGEFPWRSWKTFDPVPGEALGWGVERGRLVPGPGHNDVAVSVGCRRPGSARNRHARGLEGTFERRVDILGGVQSLRGEGRLDEQPDPYDDKDAAWRTMHVEFRAAEDIAGAGPDRVIVGWPSDGGDVGDNRDGFISLGETVIFLTPSPVYDYDTDVLAVVNDGAFIATVNDQGDLALPFIRRAQAELLLERTDTLAELRAEARKPPHTIRLRTTKDGVLEPLP